MRPPRTPPPTVEVHIDHLVVDGPHLSPRQRDHLASGLSAELESALTHLFSAATLDARPARVADVTLSMERQPARDGDDTGRGLARALVGDIGPRLVSPRTGGPR